MTPLPSLMVAPNGARRTKADHPRLPMTVPEIVAETLLAREAGADSAHIHVRDDDGKHSLDLGLYREAMSEFAAKAPGFPIQITTEAVGLYTPAEQIALVDTLQPELVSVALKELESEGDVAGAKAAYDRWAEAGIGVQHIVYQLPHIGRLAEVLQPEDWSATQMIMVLGRFPDGLQSTPEDLEIYLAELRRLPAMPDWSLCAFGQRETECLAAAHKAGGKVRVGFENSLQNSDGSIAENNAERVREVVKAIA